jgi:hypothetical protein
MCSSRLCHNQTAALKIALYSFFAWPRLLAQLHQAVVGLDQVVDPRDRDFANSGLKAVSVIRAAYLALLPRTYFKGRIGAISPMRTKQVLDSLIAFLVRASDTSA